MKQPDVSLTFPDVKNPAPPPHTNVRWRCFFVWENNCLGMVIRGVFGIEKHNRMC